MSNNRKIDKSRKADSHVANENFFHKLSNENKILKGELADLRLTIEKMGKLFTPSNIEELRDVHATRGAESSKGINGRKKKAGVEELSASLVEKRLFRKFKIVTTENANIEEVLPRTSRLQETSISKVKEQPTNLSGNFQCFNEDFYVGSYSDYVLMFEYFDFLCSLVPLDEEQTKHYQSKNAAVPSKKYVFGQTDTMPKHRGKEERFERMQASPQNGHDIRKRIQGKSGDSKQHKREWHSRKVKAT